MRITIFALGFIFVLFLVIVKIGITSYLNRIKLCSFPDVIIVGEGLERATFLSFYYPLEGYQDPTPSGAIER